MKDRLKTFLEDVLVKSLTITEIREQALYLRLAVQEQDVTEKLTPKNSVSGELRVRIYIDGITEPFYVNPEVINNILTIAKTKKIVAIKMLRDALPKMSLKEAKDYIEARI